MWLPIQYTFWRCLHCLFVVTCAVDLCGGFYVVICAVYLCGGVYIVTCGVHLCGGVYLQYICVEVFT